jgi:hypothetical protein
MRRYEKQTPKTDKDPEGSLNIKKNWDLTPIYAQVQAASCTRISI